MSPDTQHDGSSIPLADIPGRGSRLWSILAWINVLLNLLLSTLLVIFIGWPAALLGDRRRRIAHRMLGIGHAGIRLGMSPRVELTLSGLENLPDGPCILCANHQSLADVVYLYSLPLHFKWLVKKEFFRVPLFGLSMWIADYPVVDRGDPDSALKLLDVIADNLKAGVSILTFPEGTRSVTGELQSFQTGPARMAVLSQVPLVPIGVVGTGHMLPKGSSLLAPHGDLGVHVGPPLKTEGIERSSIRKLTRRLRDAVISAKTEARRRVDEKGGVK
ncbi:MAG: lysophospholipid acyltransferase family protein [Myxococcota bacterium]